MRFSSFFLVLFCLSALLCGIDAGSILRKQRRAKYSEPESDALFELRYQLITGVNVDSQNAIPQIALSDTTTRYTSWGADIKYTPVAANISLWDSDADGFLSVRSGEEEVCVIRGGMGIDGPRSDVFFMNNYVCWVRYNKKLAENIISYQIFVAADRGSACQWTGTECESDSSDVVAAFNGQSDEPFTFAAIDGEYAPFKIPAIQPRFSASSFGSNLMLFNTGAPNLSIQHAVTTIFDTDGDSFFLIANTASPSKQSYCVVGSSTDLHTGNPRAAIYEMKNARCYVQIRRHHNSTAAYKYDAPGYTTFDIRINRANHSCVWKSTRCA